MEIPLLTAKEKLCVCENMECNPAACARAKGHFDRVNDAVFELLEKEEIYDREMRFPTRKNIRSPV